MASIFDLSSGSSDSEDDVDYVPSNIAESDPSEDEISDIEETELEEPASKKIKLIAQELKNKVESGNKSADDVWQSFLKGVKTTPYGTANGKQNEIEASTSNEAAKPKDENKEECANDEKAAEAKDHVDNKVPNENNSVLKIEETSSSKEKEPDTSVEAVVRIPDPSVKPKTLVEEAKKDGSNDKPVDVLISRPRTGLSSILGSIANKGKKQSVLEKSLADWKSFKEEQGIGKDLETFNRGRSGFIERQRFLERSDVRSFENEKSLRLTGRKPPGSKN